MSEPGEGFRLGRRGLRHRLDDGIDLFLGELGERVGGRLGAAHERAGFVNGGQIAIGLGRGLRHGGPKRDQDAFASLAAGSLGSTFSTSA